jgi:hypothetical protein
MTRALQDLPAARKASAEAQAKVKAENAEYQVEVIDYETGECVRTVKAGTMRNAERVERGMLINMNIGRYYTQVVPQGNTP